MTTKKTMLVDLSNAFMIIRHSELPKDKKQDDYGAQLIFSKTLSMLCDFARKYQATDVIVANEGRNNWRKEYYTGYKANRDIETDLYYPEISQARDWLIRFFEQHSNWKVVTCDKAEADDVIAVAVQSRPEDNFVIISSDTDFVQLLRDGVTLYSPAQQKEREKPEDGGFHMFLKCIRGDKSDNIPSAYPRIQEKKLREIWDMDDGPEKAYAKQNLMETITKDSDQTVGAKFQRNKTLIDLSRQKPEVRQSVYDALQEDVNCGYEYLAALKFLREIELQEFAREFDKFSDMLRVSD